MIQQLENHITTEQINSILDIILEQHRRYIQFLNNPQFNTLFIDEYSPHRRQHDISWAIASAFPSNRSICDNPINIECLHYGKGHTTPVLFNDNIELMILSATTNFKSKYLQEYYSYNRNNFSGTKLFAFLKFTTQAEQLIDISLCLPDENGNIIKEEELFNRSTINLIKFAG